MLFGTEDRETKLMKVGYFPMTSIMFIEVHIMTYIWISLEIDWCKEMLLFTLTVKIFLITYIVEMGMNWKTVSGSQASYVFLWANSIKL